MPNERAALAAVLYELALAYMPRPARLDHAAGDERAAEVAAAFRRATLRYRRQEQQHAEDHPSHHGGTIAQAEGDDA